MLVLSRKESQRIRLGDSIVITVVRVTGDKVRLGIEAPRDIVVLRDELKPLDLELLDGRAQESKKLEKASEKQENSKRQVLAA